jgi:hypothetical protein
MRRSGGRIERLILNDKQTQDAEAMAELDVPRAVDPVDTTLVLLAQPHGEQEREANEEGHHRPGVEETALHALASRFPGAAPHSGHSLPPPEGLPRRS